MTPRVIKTKRQYEAALGRVQELMGAVPGSPEGEELELLATLVELYEESAFPIDLPDPIDAIKFRMEQAGLRPKDLAPLIGSPSKVSEVLRGKRPLSLRMIRALHSGLGIPAEVLLSEPGATIPADPSDLVWERFPISEMLKRGWLTGGRQVLADAREHAEELVKGFFAPLMSEGFSLALLRHHVRRGSKMDQYALLAWCCKALLVAQDQQLPPYEPGTIDQAFMSALVGLSYFDDGPRLAQEFLHKNGIHLIVLRHLPRTYLDGAAMLRASGAPVIVLTLRYDRLDNFWFSLCHEMGHTALHLAAGAHNCFVDDLQQKGDDVEDATDAFAMDSLIPPAVWRDARAQETGNASDVRALAASLRIHPAIVAGRIRRERGNYRVLWQLVGRNEVRKHFAEDFGCADGG